MGSLVVRVPSYLLLFYSEFSLVCYVCFSGCLALAEFHSPMSKRGRGQGELL